MNETDLFELASMIIKTASAKDGLHEIAAEDDLIENCAEWLKHDLLSNKQCAMVLGVVDSIRDRYIKTIAE